MLHRGIFHDETSVIANVDDMLLNICINLYQLWMSVNESDRLQLPTLYYDTNLPCIDSSFSKLDSHKRAVGKIRYLSWVE